MKIEICYISGNRKRIVICPIAIVLASVCLSVCLRALLQLQYLFDFGKILHSDSGSQK